MLQRRDRAVAIAHEEGDVGAVVVDQRTARRGALGVVELAHGGGVVAAPGKVGRFLGQRGGLALAGVDRRRHGERRAQAAQRFARRRVGGVVAQRGAVVGDGV
ncbi:MAG TPA: hypothetical protein VL049_29715, partial [Candidatus Dormibacteraeota bacterium]|nr:hypothetical protein [Candidatus Dormibacteraeota bacterium]